MLHDTVRIGRIHDLDGKLWADAAIRSLYTAIGGPFPSVGVIAIDTIVGPDLGLIMGSMV